MIIAVPEPPSGDFLLLVQEKVTKEKDTPDGASGSCASRHWGPRRATGHSLSCGSGAVIPDRSPDALTPMPCGARTAPYGDPTTPTTASRFVGLLFPPRRSKPSTGGEDAGLRATVFEPEARLFRARRVGRASGLPGGAQGTARGFRAAKRPESPFL